MDVQVLASVNRPHSTDIFTASSSGFLDSSTDWVTVYKGGDLWECDAYIRRNSRSDRHVYRVGEDMRMSVQQKQPIYYWGYDKTSADVLIDHVKTVEVVYQMHKLDFLMSAIGAPAKWEQLGGHPLNQWGVERMLRRHMRVDRASLYAVLRPGVSVDFYYKNTTPLTPAEAAHIIMNAASEYRLGGLS